MERTKLIRANKFHKAFACKSYVQTEMISQGDLHAKIDQNWQIALSVYSNFLLLAIKAIERRLSPAVSDAGLSTTCNLPEFCKHLTFTNVVKNVVLRVGTIKPFYNTYDS